MRKTSLVLAVLLAVAGICVMLWPVFTGHRLQADTDAAVRASSKNKSRSSSAPNCWRLYRSTTDSFTLKSSVILPILKPVRSPPPT